LQLVALSLQPSVARNVELVRGLDGAFTAQSTDIPLHREVARAAGSIQSSLFEAGQADGVPIEVMGEIIHAFSYDVDFQRDIQPGDSYEILYERYADGAGNLAKTGDIQFASLTLSGRKLAIYRYTTADGARTGSPEGRFSAQGAAPHHPSMAPRSPRASECACIPSWAIA